MTNQTFITEYTESVHSHNTTVNPVSQTGDSIDDTELCSLHCHAYDLIGCDLLDGINMILSKIC